MWRQLVEEAKAHIGLYSQVFSSVHKIKQKENCVVVLCSTTGWHGKCHGVKFVLHGGDCSCYFGD
jgi:hypothetical protein